MLVVVALLKLCFQWRNTSSVYKIALEKYKEYRYYKTKQTPVMRHYVHHAKATVRSPGYETRIKKSLHRKGPSSQRGKTWVQLQETLNKLNFSPQCVNK